MTTAQPKHLAPWAGQAVIGQPLAGRESTTSRAHPQKSQRTCKGWHAGEHVCGVRWQCQALKRSPGNGLCQQEPSVIGMSSKPRREEAPTTRGSCLGVDLSLPACRWVGAETGLKWGASTAKSDQPNRSLSIGSPTARPGVYSRTFSTSNSARLTPQTLSFIHHPVGNYPRPADC